MTLFSRIVPIKLSLSDMRRIMLTTCFTVAFLSGCIKPEAPNAEADILTAELEGVEVNRPTQITNDRITFYLNPWEELSQLTVHFTLTPGARIEPASGVPQDFSKPLTYRVTSEDGKWSKEYTVSVRTPEHSTQMLYDFENIRLHAVDGVAYQIFTTNSESGDVIDEWANPNLGYAMVNEKRNDPTTYPATQVEDGFIGKAAKFETVSTGMLGQMFGSPIAAGSMFLGTIDPANIAFEPLKATQFGIPLTRKPVMMTGYYKYTPGAELKDKKGETQEGSDLFDIYALVYERTDEVPTLDGYSILSSPNIVLMARLKEEERKSTEEWTRFELPFEPVGETLFDEKKLQDGRYNYTVVFTSSKDGATYLGAVGSTLLVDEVELFFE